MFQNHALSSSALTCALLNVAQMARVVARAASFDYVEAPLSSLCFVTGSSRAYHISVEHPIHDVRRDINGRAVGTPINHVRLHLHS